MNNILTHASEFGEVRTVELDGEIWFVGKDVAECLGYSEPRSAVSKKVEADDRGVAKMDTPSGIQEMTIINESGLYSLIFSSKLPTAKAFKHWVTSEVLPSIRKTGSYTSESFSAQLQWMMMAEKKQQEFERIQDRHGEVIQQHTDVIRGISKGILSMRDILTLDTSNWRKEAMELMRKISGKNGENFSDTYLESYDILEDRAGVDLHTRLKNRRKRMSENGATIANIEKVNRLDVIGEDKKLIEIYMTVVKEMAIKYGVALPN